MTTRQHQLYIGTMSAIVLLTTAYLAYVGYSYYALPIEERFYHPRYDWFKPSGAFGHGLGIVGTLLIVFGVAIYIARKKYGFMERYLRIKYLLEFHIFLCTLGPIMVLFHTSFKFGGIVSISFWSMVAVVASGVIGRYIYNQIPRTVQGKEISLDKLHQQQAQMQEELQVAGYFTQEELQAINTYKHNQRAQLRFAMGLLKQKKHVKNSVKAVRTLLREERKLAWRISNYNRMERLFKYWHVAHKPFALIMLIFALIHVVVTLSLGYKWIF
jgi:hypothetical protein